MLGQPRLWWQALALFVPHFADWEQRWQDSIGDLQLEQKAVHALRSAAANLGANGLAAEAATLETQLLACQAGEIDSVPERLRERLRDAYRRTWHTAAQALNSHSPAA
ncbi:MAG: hypothetical protein H6R14_2207 [Proteobacteria bacterium]|nr:hypothetical protein [Pseudomonadota bacterium]